MILMQAAMGLGLMVMFLATVLVVVGLPLFTFVIYRHRWNRSLRDNFDEPDQSSFWKEILIRAVWRPSSRLWPYWFWLA